MCCPNVQKILYKIVQIIKNIFILINTYLAFSITKGMNFTRKANCCTCL